jgi:flagellar biosynthesis chaperone FliJ
MNLMTQRELEQTREKLHLLESLYAEAEADTDGDAEVRAAEIDSLKRQINQLKEEIARFEARHSVKR